MIAIIADIVVTVLIVNDPFRDRNLFTFFYIYPAKIVPKPVTCEKMVIE